MMCVICDSLITIKNTPLCENCMKDPFRVEKGRDILAKDNKLNLLMKTYNKNFGEFLNINSPGFWDKLLSINRKTEKKSSITRDRVQTVIKMLGDQGGKLLNVGFGYGFVEEKIPKHLFELYGIEISQEAIEKLKKKVEGNFKMGSILDIPFQSESFDFVLVLEVLEHISPHDTFTALGELKRVLKKRGILIISVPLNEGLEKIYKNGLNPNGHVRVYTPKLIKAELQLAGFKINKERMLYAFGTLYTLKLLLQRTVFKHKWKPNNIVILAQKP